MSEFALYLSEELEKKDMKQADIARKSGLSTGLIAQVFSGHTKDPRFGTIIKICDAMELDIDEVADKFAKYQYEIVRLDNE